MQPDKGGNIEEIMQQNQDRRLKPMEGENQNQQQHHQPQKCPRCESVNTKFCYYNNYSLSQPRYFCKTCRRYWTQGGTLRNVPVGGGCRKGKKAKTSTNASSSSSENSSRSRSQNTNSGATTASPALISKDQSGNLVSPHHPGISSLGPPPYYSGGGFLGSLAAIQSLNNQPPSQSFSLNLPVNLGGDLGGPSNLSLLHGFNNIPSFGSQQQQQQQHIQQQRQFYQMGNRDTKSSGDHSHFYSSSSSNSQHQNWHHQAFVNNTNPTTTVSDTTLWSISTTTTTTANTNGSRNNNNTGGSFPLNPADHHHRHQWHDLPGYGPPP